ncbi:hypothetical protein Dimus_017505 [Dionaea muscipula]
MGSDFSTSVDCSCVQGSRQELISLLRRRFAAFVACRSLPSPLRFAASADGRCNEEFEIEILGPSPPYLGSRLRLPTFITDDILSISSSALWNSADKMNTYAMKMNMIAVHRRWAYMAVVFNGDVDGSGLRCGAVGLRWVLSICWSSKGDVF